LLTLIAYSPGEVSIETREVFEQSKGNLYTEKELEDEPFYEHDVDSEYHPGEVFIDCHVGQRKGLSFNGLWKVRDDINPVIPVKDKFTGGKQHVLIMLQAVKQFEGLSFPRSEWKDMEAIVRKYLEKKKWAEEKGEYAHINFYKLCREIL
jgi:hypothetical protein